jgi:phosphoribosylaminoimidazolecarboxamide formyltransferase/IMP cyclohydrolase
VRLAGERATRWWLRRHPAIIGLVFHEGVPRQARVNARMRLAEGGLGDRERAELAALVRDGLAAVGEDERADWLGRGTPFTLASDAYLPFRDNVDVAVAHGARCIVEGGGSVRSGEVEQACREHGVTLVWTGLRLFSH